MKHRGCLHDVVMRAEHGFMIDEKDFRKGLISPTVARHGLYDEVKGELKQMGLPLK